MEAGIDVHTSQGTIDSFKFKKIRRPIACEAQEKFKVGNFTVLAFPTEHDCLGSLGFVINHKESGNILFLTDSFYSKYTFKGISHYIVESNFDENIIDEKWYKDQIHPMVYGRLKKSHMSLQTCRKMLLANDLSKVKNIILIHLSNGNSDAKNFKEEITRATGKKVTIADCGVEVDLNLNTF